MVNLIRISNLDNHLQWEKQLTDGEYQEVKGYIEGRKTVAIIPATLKPVRTNNLKNFAKDFILPTTINHAIKVQGIVGKIFAILVALVLDVLTFPLRLLTCIPRIISNAKQKVNPLHKYLINEGVDKELLESGHVRVRVEWEQRSQFPTSYWIDLKGVEHQAYSQEKLWSEFNVNFIEVPIYENSRYSNHGIN